MPIPPVDPHACHGREEERRDLLRKTGDTQQDGRKRQALDQPTGGHASDPGSDEGDALSGKEQPVVPGSERPESEGQITRQARLQHLADGFNAQAVRRHNVLCFSKPAQRPLQSLKHPLLGRPREPSAVTERSKNIHSSVRGVLRMVASRVPSLRSNTPASNSLSNISSCASRISRRAITPVLLPSRLIVGNGPGECGNLQTGRSSG